MAPVGAHRPLKQRLANFRCPVWGKASGHRPGEAALSQRHKRSSKESGPQDPHPYEDSPPHNYPPSGNSGASREKPRSTRAPAKLSSPRDQYTVPETLGLRGFNQHTLSCSGDTPKAHGPHTFGSFWRNKPQPLQEQAAWMDKSSPPPSSPRSAETQNAEWDWWVWAPGLSLSLTTRTPPIHCLRLRHLQPNR